MFLDLLCVFMSAVALREMQLQGCKLLLNTHTHSHTLIHTHWLTYTHSHTHSYTHTLTHTLTCTLTHTHTHTHTLMHTHTHSHTHTLSLTHTLTHTYTHTLTHTVWLFWLLMLMLSPFLLLNQKSEFEMRSGHMSLVGHTGCRPECHFWRLGGSQSWFWA